MTINVNLKDIQYYLDDIAKKQLPYACARALTDLSAKIGTDLALMSGQRFHTTTRYARSHKTAKLGALAASVKSSSFVTLPANKDLGLSRMQATLLQQHWGLSEQMSDVSSERRAKLNKFLWVPLQKRTRTFTIGKERKKPKTFSIKTKAGRYLVMRRQGRNLKLLFSSRQKQTIIPRFSFRKITEQRAQRYMNVFFNRWMEKALR